MSDYDVQFFDLDTPVPSATVAEYGITLNPAATSMIAQWKYARVGLDKSKKLIILKPHNDDSQSSGCLHIRDRQNSGHRLRINSRDFVRIVSHHCNISLQPSIRCMAEWDDEQELLVIALNKILDTRKGSSKRGKRDG